MVWARFRAPRHRRGPGRRLPISRRAGCGASAHPRIDLVRCHHETHVPSHTTLHPACCAIGVLARERHTSVCAAYWPLAFSELAVFSPPPFRAFDPFRELTRPVHKRRGVSISVDIDICKTQNFPVPVGSHQKQASAGNQGARAKHAVRRNDDEREKTGTGTCKCRTRRAAHRLSISGAA